MTNPQSLYGPSSFTPLNGPGHSKGEVQKPLCLQMEVIYLYGWAMFIPSTTKLTTNSDTCFVQAACDVIPNLRDFRASNPLRAPSSRPDYLGLAVRRSGLTRIPHLFHLPSKTSNRSDCAITPALSRGDEGDFSGLYVGVSAATPPASWNLYQVYYISPRSRTVHRGLTRGAPSSSSVPPPYIAS